MTELVMTDTDKTNMYVIEITIRDKNGNHIETLRQLTDRHDIPADIDCQYIHDTLDNLDEA